MQERSRGTRQHRCKHRGCQKKTARGKWCAYHAKAIHELDQAHLKRFHVEQEKSDENKQDE